MRRPTWLLASFSVIACAFTAYGGESSTVARTQQTVERAIDYLREESEAWLDLRKCAACHHAPMPLWALAEAKRQGYAVDEEYLAKTFDSLLGSKAKLMASRIFPDPSAKPDPRPQGQGLNMGLPMMVVAAHATQTLGAGQKDALKLVTEEILKKQLADGSWEFFAGLRRPPINESKTTDVAWIIMALQDELDPGSPESHKAALAKAVAWLGAQKPSDLHQDKVLKVLLWSRSGQPPEAIRPTVGQLLALQRPDGGWSQTVPKPRSDAFATGQTLYALSLAGFKADDPAVKRGIDFLVSTQAKDGTWPMTSRSSPNGEEGSAKNLSPITCAATSWAALGLSRLVPKSSGKGTQ